MEGNWYAASGLQINQWKRNGHQYASLLKNKHCFSLCEVSSYSNFFNRAFYLNFLFLNGSALKPAISNQVDYGEFTVYNVNLHHTYLTDWSNSPTFFLLNRCVHSLTFISSFIYKIIKRKTKCVYRYIL